MSAADRAAIKVLVVAEYYPRAQDPTSGIWSHLQALAARHAGADIRVLVLHRPLPPLVAVRALDLSALAAAARQPASAELDELRIDYLRYLSPPRPWSYATWGAWAAPWLRGALKRIRRTFPFEVVHAHYAVPAGDAVRRAAPGVPLVVSVHGHDVYGPDAASPQVRATLAHAAMVLANTEGTARRSMDSGAAATRTRVVHLGSDLPPEPAAPPGSPPVLVSVGNLIERKRHADVVAALPRLRRRHPGLRYVVVGDGPERERLRGLAASLGVLDAVDLRGRLAHAQALAVARGSTLFVLPSVDEAFGVSYVEAMAAGVPAIGTAGEDGPREIERSGGGIELVAPRDPPALAAAIDALLSDPSRLKAMGRTARETVRREFTWEQCGRRTAEAYAAASVQRRQRQ